MSSPSAPDRKLKKVTSRGKVVQEVFEDDAQAIRNVGVDKEGDFLEVFDDNGKKIPLVQVNNPSAGGGSTAGYEKLLTLLANSNWLKLSNYESSSISVVGTVYTVSYLEDENVIAKLIFDYTDDSNWNYKLESYINDDNGDILDDDDDEPLFLD